MRVKPVRALGVHHLLHISRAPCVVHLSINRISLGERLPFLAHFRPVHVPGPQNVVVPTEKGAWLLPWEYQEVLIGSSPASLKVVLLVLETQPIRIGTVQLKMEVAQPD